MTGTQSQALVAMILREEAAVPSLEEVAGQLRGPFEELATVTIDGVDATVKMAIGDDEVAVIPRAEPLPWELIEASCADAWYWPEATSELREHRSHMAVVIRPAESEAVHRSLLLTRVVAGLLQSFGGRGVYWDPATMVHSSSAVLEAAGEMAPRRLPLRLWLHFRIIEEDPDESGAERRSLFTTGLDALGEREIEIWGSTGKPDELIGWAYNTAHYLLAERAVLENGQGIALERDRFVHVFIKPSMFDADRDVYCLLLEK